MIKFTAMKKSYYQKLAFLGMLLIVFFVFQNYRSREKEDFSDVHFVTANSHVLELSEFNPNDLDGKQWQNLGFTEKQTAIILNYKKVIGGQFLSKEQFRKCFAVSGEKFSELEPYILLPESNREAKSSGFKRFEKKSVTVSGKFNPDLYSANDWMKIGFSERQAQAIIRYKDYLGGSFVSKEKLAECFIISEENFKIISPYLILPEKTPANYSKYPKKLAKNQIQYHTFDPNTLNVEDWKSLGFSDKQAQTIVNYRDRNLKGSFKSIEDIQRCFVISAEKFDEMKPFIRLNPATTANIHQNQSAEIRQQEKTDFSKIDLNAITFKQLLEFGFDEKAAGSMIGFRKKLGGFVNKEQILTTYNIDPELMQKLLATAQLNTSNVIKYTLTDAPEDWLKNHPYFKYSADKIIFYRLSEKDEKKIWKLLRLKPEYETRMKLYLR